MRLLLALLALLAAPAAASPASDRAAILTVVEHMEDAWNRGDFRGYMAGFKNPDVVFVSGGKFQQGWQGTLDHYVRDYGGSPERRGKLHFYNMKVDILAPDAADAGRAIPAGARHAHHRGREHAPVPEDRGPLAHHDEPRLGLRRDSYFECANSALRSPFQNFAQVWVPWP